MKKFIRTDLFPIFRSAVTPFMLFTLAAGGVWVAFSSPRLPAEEGPHGATEPVAAASAEASPVASGAPSAEDKKKKRKPASLEAAAECLTDENAIADIRSRQDELDLRQKELDSRAAEVDSKERALADQLKKIEAARDEIKKVEELRSKEQGSKVGKVVETFETMTPKSVSSMLSAMDENLAVEAINRMTTPKLAKVLNLMEPSKSSRLTELLVGMRAKVESKSSVPPSGAERSPSSQLEAGAEKTASEKGGE